MPIRIPTFTPKSKQAGFTIIELLVVTVVFAVTVPALASMISLLGSINGRARDLSTIHALVENKVESLRSISFTGMIDGTTDFTGELPATISPPRSATHTISAISPSLKQIEVNVTYSDRGQPRNLTYKTYIGELGVGQY